MSPLPRWGEGGFSDLDPEAQARLPEALATAERLARDWDLQLEGHLPGATCSLVLAAGEFVLRMPLLDWERGTSGLLEAFAPHGGVRVLREDPQSGAVLLPRLRSGLPLDTLPEHEATDAWIILARRLRNAEGDAPSVEAYLQPLWTQETDLKLKTDAPALACRLVETSPERRLLHGDLHHFNVLRHGDAWIAIDPEGISGDPAYEAAAFIRNPVPAIGREPDLPTLLRRRILRLAAGLNEPAERIWGWALVRTALCVWEDPTPFDGAWLAVTHGLDALAPEFGKGF